MKYRIVWTKEAERDLTRLWLGSRWRYLITAATHEIEQVLCSNPWNIGESREGNKRIMFVEPLGVDYEVSEEKRTVYITAVWEY